MPIFADAAARIIVQLETIERGERVGLITIGELTRFQFDDLNRERAAVSLALVESPEIVYLGRHHFSSRRAQGYTVADMVMQIESALAHDARPRVTRKGTILESARPRSDGYGNQVCDQAVLELTARKPRVEVFSVVPKGDRNPPKATKPR